MPRFSLLSFLLRNLDVTSQGHLDFFQIIFSFSQKYVFFMLGNNIFTFFDRKPSMALFALLGHPQYQSLKNVVQNIICDIYGVFKLHLELLTP